MLTEAPTQACFLAAQPSRETWSESERRRTARCEVALLDVASEAARESQRSLILPDTPKRPRSHRALARCHGVLRPIVDSPGVRR
jgi:hypothetical protein